MPFINSLVVKLVDHFAYHGQGAWELVEPLAYVTESGALYEIPVGFITDFASVPRAPIAYVLTGNTFHAPAVLHDFLVSSEKVSREYADTVFLEAMSSLIPDDLPNDPKLGYEAVMKLRWRAGMMYRAVSSYTEQLKEDPWGERG